MIEIQRYLIELSLLRYRKIIDKTREINKYYGTSTFGTSSNAASTQCAAYF